MPKKSSLSKGGEREEDTIETCIDESDVLMTDCSAKESQSPLANLYEDFEHETRRSPRNHIKKKAETAKANRGKRHGKNTEKKEGKPSVHERIGTKPEKVVRKINSVVSVVGKNKRKKLRRQAEERKKEHFKSKLGSERRPHQKSNRRDVIRIGNNRRPPQQSEFIGSRPIQFGPATYQYQQYGNYPVPTGFLVPRPPPSVWAIPIGFGAWPQPMEFGFQY